MAVVLEFVNPDYKVECTKFLLALLPDLNTLNPNIALPAASLGTALLGAVLGVGVLLLLNWARTIILIDLASRLAGTQLAVFGLWAFGTSAAIQSVLARPTSAIFLLTHIYIGVYLQRVVCPGEESLMGRKPVHCELLGEREIDPFRLHRLSPCEEPRPKPGCATGALDMHNGHILST